MKVLICGGREGVDDESLHAALDELMTYWPYAVVVGHGAARGVDTQVGVWAAKRYFKIQAYPVDKIEDGDGNDAPLNRNKRMFKLFKPDLCIGFNGGAGTNHMMKHAHENGVRVIDIDIQEDKNFGIYQWTPSQN